ncbi:MAG: tRNA dihydrouridine synthase DusB, partial [Betaproteobacteria bacterium]|nr:tRNA dihydrouridine synthase DusB [Betaproteobacteria bacterium]
GAEKGVRIARKHIAWYVGCAPGADVFRQAMNQLASIDAQRAATMQFFDGLLAQGYVYFQFQAATALKSPARLAA